MHTTPEINVLQVKLHEKRKQMAELRKEMDEIESKLLPMLNRESAINKFKRAGLSEAEFKSLMETVK